MLHYSRCSPSTAPRYCKEKVKLANFLYTYNLHRLAMVFLCTFFAYDSAKLELKKAKLAK